MATPAKHIDEPPQLGDQLAVVERAIDSMRLALADLERARAVLAVQPIEAEAERSPKTGRDDDDLLELDEAAMRFRVAKDTLRSWARRENIGVKRGGRWLVSISQLHEWPSDAGFTPPTAAFPRS